MKGIILAGGLGSRLSPLTLATNKHLLPVFDKPMVFYPIETLVRAGIKEVMLVVSGPHSGDFIQILGNGDKLGLDRLLYGYQEKPDGGIADALSIAANFTADDDDDVTVILGDNTTDADLSQAVQGFNGGAHLFLKEVPDPERFGVAEIVNDNIVSIVEKPKEPKSNLAVTGMYMYDSQVFEFIKRCSVSARGELEITDVNNFYLERNMVSWSILEGYWRDAGTFQTLYEANKYWAEKHAGG